MSYQRNNAITGVQPGIITLESQGALGDDNANDQAAYAAALAVLAASNTLGTGARTIRLGSNRTYKITGGTLPAGCAIIGDGSSTLDLGSSATTAIIIGGNYCRVEGVRITGGNVAGQVGVRNGTQGSAGSGFSIGIVIDRVIVEACATGIEMNEYGAATHRGPVISNCTVLSAKGFTAGRGGIVLGNVAEYTTVHGCRTTQCEVGIMCGAGNLNISACQSNDSSYAGIWIRGDLGNTWLNDAHGLITACTVNHSTGDALKVDAIVNGMNIVGCSFQGGTVTLTGSSGVHLKQCFFDLDTSSSNSTTSFTFDGSQGTVIEGSTWINNVTPTVTNNANNHSSSTRWTSDNLILDGTFPAWILGADDQSGFTSPMLSALQLPRQPSIATLTTDVGGYVGSPVTNPLSLPGTQLWLRADLGVTQAGTVSAWADQSGNGDANRNHTQATGGNRPAFVASDSNYNSQATIGPFSGSATLLASGVWSVAPPETGTMFFVCDIQNASAGTIIDSLSAQRYTIYRNSTNLAGSFSNNGNFGVAPHIANRPCIVIIDMNGAKSLAYVNGMIAMGSHDLGSSSPTGTTLGNAQAPGGVPSNGQIAEVWISNTRLTAGQRQSLLMYAAKRYNINIAAE